MASQPTQNTQGGSSQGSNEPYRLKNAQMEVIGYSSDPVLTIELKFTLKNGEVKYFSKSKIYNQ